jgi:hypothetical protein
LPGSLLSRHGSLWFLIVPQIEEATEGFPFWQPRGHHAERDEGAEKLSRNASSSGRNVGLSVWSHKGPTLKGIRNLAPLGITFFSWPKVGYFLDRVVYASILCVPPLHPVPCEQNGSCMSILSLQSGRAAKGCERCNKDSIQVPSPRPAFTQHNTRGSEL